MQTKTSQVIPDFSLNTCEPTFITKPRNRVCNLRAIPVLILHFEGKTAKVTSLRRYVYATNSTPVYELSIREEIGDFFYRQKSMQVM